MWTYSVSLRILNIDLSECVAHMCIYRVPLDYFDGSAGVAKVALGRYNATRSPRKGIVLMNPGTSSRICFYNLGLTDMKVAPEALVYRLPL